MNALKAIANQAERQAAIAESQSKAGKQWNQGLNKRSIRKTTNYKYNEMIKLVSNFYLI